MPRLFTAIEIPQALDKLLAPYIPNSENIIQQPEKHITLQFLGDVSPAQFTAFSCALEDLNATTFNIQLKKCNLFDSRGPARFFVAEVSPNIALIQLYQKIGKIMRAQNLIRDHRPYKPHLTLARLEGADGELCRSLLNKGKTLCETFRVQEFVLYGVEQGRPPVYKKLKKFKLNK